MDIDLQLENFILEATTPRLSRTICWVTGTNGLDAESFVYSLQCEILVPESIKEQHERECNDELGLPGLRNTPLDLAKWGSNEHNTFPDIETFTKFIFNAKLPEAYQIREWIRLYPVTSSEFSSPGVCEQLINKHDYEEFAKAWRKAGFSDDGEWTKDGIKRHSTYTPSCPYCQARLDKHTAAGAPILSGNIKLSKETMRKKFAQSGIGSDLGFACGDPVRPKSRTNIPGIMTGTRLRAQDNPETKLWPHAQNRYLTKYVRNKYAPLILQTVKDKLAIPQESEEFFYGPEDGEFNWPSNMELILKDEQYCKANLGKPEVQHRVWGPRGRLEYLTSHSVGADASDAPRFLDLSKIEKHYTYSFTVEIHLDPEFAWMKDGKDGAGTTLKSALINRFSASFAQFKSSNNPDKYLVDRWVDSHGNCFPIYKIPTGIKGLDALLNPFMPAKTVIDDGQVFTDELIPSDVIPQYSDFWSYGGRNATHLYESLNEFLEVEFAGDPISLAPFNQFAPYPIDRDGNVYIIHQCKLFMLKNGQKVVGRIVRDSWQNFKGEINAKNYKKDQKIGYYVVETAALQVSGKKSKTLNVPALGNQFVLSKMAKKSIIVRKSDIEDEADATFDSVDFSSVHKLHGSISLFNDDAEEAKVKAQAKLLLKQMGPEQIDHLLRDIKAEISGNKSTPQAIKDSQKVLGQDLGLQDQDLGEKNPVVPVYSPAILLTKPELIFGKLINELQKPREVVDHGRWYLVDERNRDGEPISYAQCAGSTIFSWEAIEDPNHPNHPYFRGSDGEYYHPLHADVAFKASLIERGDIEDLVTKQWVRRKLVSATDNEGDPYDRWIRYNSVEYLRDHVNLEGIKEDLRSRLRPSAQKSNNLKDILIGLKETSINPESTLSQKAYERRMAYKQKTTPPTLEKWKNLWVTNNIKRIVSDDQMLYPAPRDELCPSLEYWMKDGIISPDVDELDLDHNLRSVKETKLWKEYWPCRQCRGSGEVEEKPCPRCHNPKNLSRYRDMLEVRVSGHNVMTRTVWADLWTGKEWIQYIWACRRYAKEAKEISKNPDGVKLTTLEADIRSMMSDYLIVPYDNEVILNRIKYKPGESVDISALSKLDLLMIPANQPDAPPFAIRPDNAEKISRWVSGMIAIHTTMTMQVLPPQLQALLANQEISHKIRMDTLYTDIITADELENINNVEEDFMQKLAKARSKIKPTKELSDDEGNTEDLDSDDIKQIAKDLADDEDDEEEDAEEDSSDEDEETPEEKQELRDVYRRETEIQTGRLKDEPEEEPELPQPEVDEDEDYSKLAPITARPDLVDYDDEDDDPFGLFDSPPAQEDTEDDDTQQSQ